MNEDKSLPKCEENENEKEEIDNENIRELNIITEVDMCELKSITEMSDNDNNDKDEEDIWITIEDQDIKNHPIIFQLIEYTNNQINSPFAYSLVSVDSIEHNIKKSDEDKYILFLNIYDQVEKHMFIVHNKNKTISVDDHDIIEVIIIIILISIGLCRR